MNHPGEMRKSRLFTIVVAIAAVTALFLPACEAPQHDTEPETAMDTASVEDFSMSNKIGASLRQALRDTTDSITVLVKVDTTSAPDAADQLKAAGLDVRTRAGDIYTAQAPPPAIRDAAELPFVVSLQLSEIRP